MPRFTVNYEDDYQRPPSYQQPPPPPPQQQSIGFGIIPMPIVLIFAIPVVLALFRPMVFTMPGNGGQPVIINNKNG